MRFGAFGLVMGLAFLSIGCSKPVDVVNGVPPVATTYANISETLNQMAILPADQRGAYLERTWPNLERGVVYYLRSQNKLRPNQRVNRVEFRYGSLDKVQAESGDGNNRFGYFRDQLVAMVYVSGTREPIAVIVQCLNGTFALLEDLNKLELVGSHIPIEQFTIGPREGLIHHVDFPTAVDLADRFNLPLYRGKSMAAGTRISPEQARRLESTTDRLQVTVYVVEGDHFDLVDMRFTPSPRRGSRA